MGGSLVVLARRDVLPTGTGHVENVAATFLVVAIDNHFTHGLRYAADHNLVIIDGKQDVIVLFQLAAYGGTNLFYRLPAAGNGLMVEVYFAVVLAADNRCEAEFLLQGGFDGLYFVPHFKAA